ncbi:hypothetical protein EVAR_36233_1 [Eumeta japonica]|uniref:Transposase Tc1-like domain-containing protein n=1 Tax=Eumeta variegata TaxID=151549 RepID=A0A4C1WXB3_EUMVA|nr:hypothetical protein EVAR_36233_1 [Eumeta japonica]
MYGGKSWIRQMKDEGTAAAFLKIRPRDALLRRRPKTISAVWLMIKTDKRVTYRQMRTSSGIGMSQVHEILHKHLAVRKLRARWISHNLTEAQKLHRVTWCREMMQRFAGGGSYGVCDTLI